MVDEGGGAGEAMDTQRGRGERKKERKVRRARSRKKKKRRGDGLDETTIECGWLKDARRCDRRCTVECKPTGARAELMGGRVVVEVEASSAQKKETWRGKGERGERAERSEKKRRNRRRKKKV